MAIYFRFKSEKSYDSISLNEPFISVASFKQKVYELRYKGKKNAGLCAGNDFDIMVINAQTNHRYDDQMLIPNHTSVLIQRVPGGRRCKFIDTTTIVVPGSHIPRSSGSNSVSASTSTSISTSSYGTDVGDAFAKNTETVTSKKLCSSASIFPDELVCRLCKKSMKDATFTSKCCFNSFCDKCIRDHLIISNFICVCGATDMLTDYLIPNITVRGLIRSMLESGFTIAQPQTSASTSTNILAIHPQTSSGDCDLDRVAQPQASASADVPIAQPQTPISASKSASIRVAVEEEAVQQKEVAHEIGKKKRKRENSENVEATDRYLMRTGFCPNNSFGMNLTGYMRKASFGVQ